MDAITTLIHGINAVPGDAWVSLLGVVGLSAFQQKIKNWLELENPKVLVFMTSVFSLAGAVVPAILGWMSASPEALAAHSALWFTGMTLAYRYVIQPGTTTLESWKSDVAKYKAYKNSKSAEAAATTTPDAEYLDKLAAELPEEEQASAELPAGVTPEFEG